jgi:hypothetical protein
MVLAFKVRRDSLWKRSSTDQTVRANCAPGSTLNTNMAITAASHIRGTYTRRHCVCGLHYTCAVCNLTSPRSYR